MKPRPAPLPLFLFLAAFACALVPARAADTASPPTPPATPASVSEAPKSRFDRLESAGVKLTRGPATVPLGGVAEIAMPADFAFVGPDGLKKFYELTENRLNGREVGVLLAARDWMLFFDYNDVGYVKDDDKDKLDADKLFTALTEHQDEANEARKAQGWSAIRTVGWTTKPHYDEKTHNLKWALTLASSEDNFKSNFINESIRLLGRGGVMNATLVCGTEQFSASETAADKVLAGQFSYVSGQKYSEWKTGDKVAAIGLGALVLGGAGVLASKAGLFAKLGALLLAAKKLVVLAVVAVAAFFKKLWSKITGRS